MRKFFTLLLTAFAMGTTGVMAQDFTLLVTPEDVLKYSVEDTDGAKAAFQDVISGEASEEEIAAAMQEYEQKATPAPGYAFDMTFLLIHPSVSESINKSELAKGWFCDVVGVSDIAYYKDDAAGSYLRVNDASRFMDDDAMGQYMLYQKPVLAKGKYLVTVQAYATRNGKVVTLSAGETDGPLIVAGSTLSDYSLYFNVKEAGETKMGARRNMANDFDWSKSPITKVAFNNMKLYKVSSTVVADAAATEPLAAAEGVDVQLKRTFEKDRYYAICLPFVIENWRDVFDDLLLWNNATETTLNFNTVARDTTQARKPYLVKMKEDITEDNYLVFENVTVASGNPGSWVKDGSEFSMVGNWGTMALPEDAYVLSDGKFVADADAQLPAFSAYMVTTAETPAAEMEITINGVASGIKAASIFGNPDRKVDVWSMDGKLLKRGVSKADAVKGLEKGLYIIDGKKVVL